MKKLFHQTLKRALELDLKDAERSCSGLEAVPYLKDVREYWETTRQCLEGLLTHFDTRILFVFPNLNTNISWSPAIQTLNKYLRKNGYLGVASHLNQVNRKGLDGLLQDIKDFAPRIIGFTATSFEYEQSNVLAKFVKKVYPRIPLVLGGIHATLNPEDIKQSSFDGFCIGEGEKPLLELMKKIEREQNYYLTKGFIFKHKGKVYDNGVVPFIQDLEEVGMMDWEVFNTPKILEQRNGWLSIGFSRGCPYVCGFCINDALKKIKGVKGYVRRRNVDSAIEELVYLARMNDGVLKVFNLDDDLVTSDFDWLKEFLEKYSSQSLLEGIGLKLEARIDNMNPEKIRLLKDKGCMEVQFGVECGNEEYRKRVLRKNISNQQITDVFDECNRVGLRTMAFMMFGLPDETEQHVNESLELLARIKPDLIRPSFFYPIQKTALGDYCVQNKLLRKDIKIITPFDEASIQTAMDADKLQKIVRLSPWYINALLGHTHYQNAIDTVSSLNEKTVLAKDEELSQKTRGTHYQFFKKNRMYLEKVKE